MGLIRYINIPNNLWKGIYQTGSTVICNPPITDTDEDYIIYTNEIDALIKFLCDSDFTASTEDLEEYELEKEGFFCLRKDHLNLIITDSKEFYSKFVRATRLAKKLNLTKKEDRIILFQDYLYFSEDSPKELSQYDC